jgi:hypothetical protein
LSLEPSRDFFYAWHTGDTQGAKQKAFSRARKAFVDLGRMTAENDIYHLTDSADVFRLMLKANPDEPIEVYDFTARGVVDQLCQWRQADNGQNRTLSGFTGDV